MVRALEVSIPVKRSAKFVPILLAVGMTIPAVAAANVTTSDSKSDVTARSAKKTREAREAEKTLEVAGTRLRRRARRAGTQFILAVRSQMTAHPVRTALGIAGSVGVLLDDRAPIEQPVLTVRPTGGDLSSPFGKRQDPIRKRRTKMHRGLDFRGKRGTPVLAAGSGVIVKAKRNGGYGRVVYIDHGLGLQTRYAHLRGIDVKEGEFVEAGHQVGRLGSSGRSTGPHLHFEVRLHGKAVDPSVAMATPLGFERTLSERMAEMFAPKKKKRRRSRKRPTKRSKKKFVPRSVRNTNLL